ncbi:MAG: glycosyltransferase family A protein [Candidatus Faecousia sp.]|nr:glycosyltransferase family A protein [Candidatus Faecousia sp.]
MCIRVSIICNAYNHEAYIADALEGFVMQKTTFPFEVLVHDDASTDNTAQIIREYEKKYPQLIKPIYETENQYSKKDGSLGRIQYGRAQGDYIALCEGDDYWTDPLKLQKQFDALEQNPQIDMCAHQASMYDCRVGKVTRVLTPVQESRILTADEVIRGGGGYFATNSLFYRKTLQENKPIFRQYLNLDYSLQIHGALRGGVLFLDDNMSVYRLMTNGSWTQRTSGDPKKYAAHWQEIITMLSILDKETFGKYSEAVEWSKRSAAFSMYQVQRHCGEMLRPEYAEFFAKLRTRAKLGVILRAFRADLAGLKRVFK